MFLLPGSGNANGSIYNFIFSKPTINGEAATIGTNAGTIAMLIEIIGLLCVAATLRSLQKRLQKCHYLRISPFFVSLC